MIPSDQRATILSFDSLFSSAGGIVAQPVLSRSADVWGYPVSYLFSAAGSALALPFLWRARQLARSRRHRDRADRRPGAGHGRSATAAGPIDRLPGWVATSATARTH